MADHRSFEGLAHRLADRAGEIQRRWFRTPLSVDTKADSSPVTVADREAEAAMRELIRAAHPDHGILGEEHGSEALDAEFVWVLDPIDGTKSFITGRPQFGTLIALLREGRPVLGVIDQSITRERWVGLEGTATALNGRPVAARPCDRLDAAVLYTTAPQMFVAAGEKRAFAAVEAAVRQPMYGGDCYAYGLLAAGFVDLIVEASMQPYDYMALVPVVAGAGGLVTGWRGEALGLRSAGRVLAAGDRRLHAAALPHLAVA